MTATSEPYEPLDDIELPPSGWLHTEPCISFGYLGAEFGGEDTDWAAFAEVVLLPNSITR
ncbi:hypothetical protein [Candidatus Poriferisodalis sp.]|uniref:hypothetical protein n=1 Tax=Candidatus Poriferisodalis sp. TaxID=3101277 RepID=UPI003B024B92